MIPAYAYIRVSDPNQLAGDGPERQETAIRLLATAKGYEIISVFLEARTGTDEFREVWRDMVAQCMDSGVKVVIIEGLDRLARDLGVQEYILRDINKRGIELVSTREDDLNTKDATRVMFRQLMGMIAQYDRTMITKKLYDARSRMRARGEKCEGIHAYGAHPKKPEEKGVLELMRALKATGKSYLGVTDELNKRGVLARGGKKWHYGSVRRILGRKR